MTRSPTIRDVAQRAGVGVGTVSRVLNDSEQVSDTTRERVLAVIKELNYEPNAAARQLSGGKTYTIGVITPFLTFPSFVQRLIGIQEVLDESEYEIVLYSIRSIKQLRQRLHMLLAQNRVDGLLILSLPFAEDEIREANPDFPIVVVDNAAIKHYPHIMIDDVKGGKLATRYLIDQGHERIGFIGDHPTGPFGFDTTRHRFDGFRQALAQAGLALNEDWCQFVKHSEGAARLAGQRILSQLRRPTALFVSMDTLAFGVLAAADDLDIRVPGEIALIGFDDIPAAHYMRLTTVRQPLIESGRLGARYLLDWLTAGHPDKARSEIEMPLSIVERATV